MKKAAYCLKFAQAFFLAHRSDFASQESVKASLFKLTLISLSFGYSTATMAQNDLKAAVVRIENTKRAEVGAGFIIKLSGQRVYVVTAAHVISGDQYPHVYFFNRQDEPVTATVISKEEDDLNGIALLSIKSDSQMLSGLRELRISATSDLGNGDNVTVIGFPGTNLWTVDAGRIVRLEGNNLVLSASARHGNSGGPVILNQRAVGLVTNVTANDVYAVRGEIIVPYVNGFQQDLISLVSSSKTGNEFTYRVSGWIESGRPRVRQSIDQPIRHKGYFALNGKDLWAFDLTVTQFTNGQLCNKGTIKNPPTASFDWGYPKGRTSSDVGEARPNFEFGVQQAKNSTFLEILLNPGLKCTLNQ